MAANTILLWPGSPTLPDGSSGNAFAQAQVVQSSGAAPTNGPKLHFEELLFDASTDEHAFFAFRLPDDYSSGGNVDILWKSSATDNTKSVVWKACIAAGTPGAGEAVNSKSLPAPDTATTNDHATAHALVGTNIALSGTALDGAAAGDLVLLMVGRDADNGSDTVTVDAAVVAVSFEYTAA